MKLPFPVIDIHTHLWGDATGLAPRPGNESELTEMADLFDLEAFVVLPLFGGYSPSPAEIMAGNDAAAAFARREPRARPFVTVYPRSGDHARRELRRCIEDMGFHGLKIWVSLADEPVMFPLVEQMIEYGKPILIHGLRKSVGQLPLESSPSHIARLAERYPEARIIHAHLGGNFLHGVEAIRHCPNVMADPSGTYCEAGMLEHAVRLLGADRMLFGTDAPLADFTSNVAKVMAADLTPDDQYRIMYGNAKELLQ